MVQDFRYLNVILGSVTMAPDTSYSGRLMITRSFPEITRGVPNRKLPFIRVVHFQSKPFPTSLWRKATLYVIVVAWKLRWSSSSRSSKDSCALASTRKGWISASFSGKLLHIFFLIALFHHYLEGFIHPRCCRIFSINRIAFWNANLFKGKTFETPDLRRSQVQHLWFSNGSGMKPSVMFETTTYPLIL